LSKIRITRTLLVSLGNIALLSVRTILPRVWWNPLVFQAAHGAPGVRSARESLAYWRARSEVGGVFHDPATTHAAGSGSAISYLIPPFMSQARSPPRSAAEVTHRHTLVATLQTWAGVVDRSGDVPEADRLVVRTGVSTAPAASGPSLENA
jgi:hypothetical protein